MSVRNLDALLEPASIALIGVGGESDPVGRVLARNLLGAGFAGPVMRADRDVEAIRGLPGAPDLAVIASPPQEVPALVAALAARGARAAVITSSFAGQERSATLQQATLDAAKPTCMRILGPGCLGLMVPGHGLNVGFAERPPVAGNLAFIAQSGGVLNSVLDWAGSRNIGFSHLVATGDMADVDVGDLLDYLATDRHTRAILLHLEALSEARKFMSAARAAARARPVVVIKAGRFAETVRPPRRAGAPIGADAVYRAAFRRAGMLEIETLDEAFDAVESLATDLDVAGDRLAIVSDSGGMAVLALDALLTAGGRLAALAPETIGRLDRVLPAHWSRTNPVDLIGDAPGERYGHALDAVLADHGNDAVLVVHCPSALADGREAAEATVAAARRHRRPLLTSWVGETAAAGAHKLFAVQHIATYATPGEAVGSFVHLACYRRNQAILLEAPPSIPESFSPEPEVAERVIDAALAEGREELTAPEVAALLAAYDLGIVATAPGAQQATVRVTEDPLFGPVIRLDLEGRGEQAVGLPPLNLALAYELLREAAPASPKDELALTLVKVSQMVCDLDRVVGLELDLALAVDTVFVRSARARISSRRTGVARLAIRPYPRSWSSRSCCVTARNCCCVRSARRMRWRSATWSRIGPGRRIAGSASSARSRR